MTDLRGTASSIRTARILIVDDDPDQCTLLETALRRSGHTTVAVGDPSAAIDLLAEDVFDIALVDIGLEGMSGHDLCERVRGTKPDTVVILITGNGTMEAAMTALRAGAFDLLVKPLEARLVDLAIQRALKHRALNVEVGLLRRRSAGSMPEDIVGSSVAMRRTYELVRRVAGSDGTVLVGGETGTGKELIARAIHAMSDRAGKPFVAINCAAVPPTLLESELFGHVRGAYTDAKTARQGLFLEANGGTLFLDEIGEMPLELQPKLLRVLQERTVRAVGGDVETPFDARVVVATNRDLEAEVAAGRFRQDLFYRVDVIKVCLPPLRARGDDVLLLANRFLERYGRASGKPNLRIAPDAAERLTAYPWPGNVRELENAMERGVAMARGDVLTMADLPDKVRTYRAENPVLNADDPSEVITLEELERRYLLRVLKAGSGNKSRVAQMLGLDRRTLYRKLERYKEADRLMKSLHG